MKLKIAFAFTAVALLSVSTASAQLVMGNGWEIFGWEGLGTVGGFGAGNGLFTFAAATPFQIEIADCCIRGDQFSLSWTGTTTGFFNTSTPIDDGSTSGIDPDVAFADPLNSTGTMTFGPGTYNFDLATILLTSESSEGNGWIRADVSTSVTPEPATFGMMATGLVGMAGMVRRRRKA